MAFDGIITMAMAKEIADEITLGKIDKVYQPEPSELVLHIHTKKGNRKLYATVDSMGSSLRFTEENMVNPPNPLSFCMLLRKHIQGGRIISVEQKDSERIIEISMETLNELGFTVSKKLIFEIMGKHSNIVLVDLNTGKIIDSIKRISIDVNRARQLLPGKIYEYPPVQDKVPFKTASNQQIENSGNTPKQILSTIGGISPAIAQELFETPRRAHLLSSIIESIDAGKYQPRVYVDSEGIPREFHITDLSDFEKSCSKKYFDDLSGAVTWYFNNKKSSNRARQKSHDLVRHVSSTLEKLYLKDKRLKEDLLAAENSEELRLHGELLTANMHLIRQGASEITLTNYYDGSDITIPLDPRFSPNKNAQIYFKRFGKSKTAIKEKKIQIRENKENIDYLESVLTFLNNTDSILEIQDLRSELEESGYVKRRKKDRYGRKKKYKADPKKYETSGGFQVLVGKNNKENDLLTFQIASKTDYWFHTKDIPGSHVILLTKGQTPRAEDVYETASIAAYFSKGRMSSNVPVDYVKVRYVKKPSGAKPGMVIFTHNSTVWVDPKLPGSTKA